MRFLQASEAEIGRTVLYAGEDEAEGVLDPDLLRAGCILKWHHPGVIKDFYGPGLNHCLVEFVGLEGEVVSTAWGFDHDADGRYPGLLVPSEAEWNAALSSGWWNGQRDR